MSQQPTHGVVDKELVFLRAMLNNLDRRTRRGSSQDGNDSTRNLFRECRDLFNRSATLASDETVFSSPGTTNRGPASVVFPKEVERLNRVKESIETTRNALTMLDRIVQGFVGLIRHRVDTD